MNTENQHIATNELLVKYLADEAQADERVTVERWIADSEENALHFQQVKRLWDAGQRLAPPIESNADAAWQRFKKRVEKGDISSRRRTFHFSWLRPVTIVATVAIAAIVATRLTYHRETPVIPKPAEKHKAAVTIDTIVKKQPDTGTHLRPRREKTLVQKDFPIPPKANNPEDILLRVDSLQKIVHEPSSWPLALERYSSPVENLAIRRAIVGHLREEMTTQQVAGQALITSFRLNESEFYVNGRRQPDSVCQWYKDRFIKTPGFFIYFGGPRRPGQGIYLGQDSLIAQIHPE